MQRRQEDYSVVSTWRTGSRAAGTPIFARLILQALRQAGHDCSMLFTARSHSRSHLRTIFWQGIQFVYDVATDKWSQQGCVVKIGDFPPTFSCSRDAVWFGLCLLALSVCELFKFSHFLRCCLAALSVALAFSFSFFQTQSRWLRAACAGVLRCRSPKNKAP